MRIFAAGALLAPALLAMTAACTTSEGSTELAAGNGCRPLDIDALGYAGATSRWVPAAEGMPAFCEVQATLSPAEGSQIGVVYRMPEPWNGKLLGLGGGGWAGNVTPMAAAEGLGLGYAVMQTDAGHAATTIWDTSWASNPAALEDFSHRAVHEMTVAGKRLIGSYYGRQHERAYFQGCSTGGRMALMEAQRYPEDYDAISAGAPVYTLQVQTSAILRNQAFAKDNGGFSPADLQLAQDAAVKACDAQDGQADGLINDPRQCRWDPAELQCTGAKTASCLAPAQVTALRTAYQGARGPDGEWAMHPLSRGGEAGWSAFIGTNGTGSDMSYSALNNLFPLALGRPVDLANFSLAEVQALRATAFAKMYEAGDPNLQPFFQRGGKLILWHGESDPGPSPVGTIDYANEVGQAAPAAGQSLRTFLYPGVGHCAGGPGAFQVRLLEALDGWVESGQAPERLVGTNPESGITRPHCALPNVARYSGNGNPNEPANWQCVPRQS
jgi:feruloyl esterase